MQNVYCVIPEKCYKWRQFEIKNEKWTTATQWARTLPLHCYLATDCLDRGKENLPQSWDLFPFHSLHCFCFPTLDPHHLHYLNNKKKLSTNIFLFQIRNFCFWRELSLAMTQNNDNDKAAVPGEELVDTSRSVAKINKS